MSCHLVLLWTNSPVPFKVYCWTNVRNPAADWRLYKDRQRDFRAAFRYAALCSRDTHTQTQKRSWSLFSNPLTICPASESWVLFPGMNDATEAQNCSENTSYPGENLPSEREVMSQDPTDKQEFVKPTPQDKPPSDTSSSPGEFKGQNHEGNPLVSHPYLYPGGAPLQLLRASKSRHQVTCKYSGKVYLLQEEEAQAMKLLNSLQIRIWPMFSQMEPLLHHICFTFSVRFG